MNSPDTSVYSHLESKFGFSWVPLMMTGPNAGKRPTEKNWTEWCEERRPLSAIRYQWSLGIATGPASGVIVLDIDNLTKFKKLGLDVPKTFSVRTGSGGEHHFYIYPNDGQKYGNRSYANGTGIFDVRGIGGQVVAPGSVHIATGNMYEIIDDTDIAEAPQWLLDYSLTGNLGGKVEQPAPAAKIAPPVTNMFDWDCSIDRLPVKQSTRNLITCGVPVGQRSEATMTVLCALVWSGLGDDDIISIFEQYPIGEKYLEKGQSRERWLLPQIAKAREMVVDRADMSSPGKSADNGFDRPKEGKAKFRKNDHLGPARSVVASFGEDNLIYAPDNFFWTWRNHGVWERIDDREIKAKIPNVLEGETFTRGFADAVTDMAKTVAYKPDHKFDVTMEGVNCRNGELIYRDGGFILQPHCREHFRTSLIPVKYDPKATAIRFESFLREIFHYDDDKLEKAQLVLEAIGYSLQSYCRFEKFVLLVGPGANGKSVLMSTVMALLGIKNVCAVSPNQFENRFQRAYLHCKLANMVTEIPEGHVIADAALKAIVSGELTTAEHKHKPPFDFRPYATCWFGTNHMPHTRDFSDALFRRAIVIPFNRIFTEAEQDKKLVAKLEPELPGILRLSLEAFAGVIERGSFTKTKSTEQAKQDWRLESDQAAQFINEACDMDPEGREESARLYKSYRLWAADNGINRLLTRRTFTNRMTRLGCQTVKGSKGARMVAGVKVKDNYRDLSF